MTCERVRTLLSDYLDGELSPVATAGVRSHLQHCFDCEQEHQALRRTVHLVALHGRQTVPVDCRDLVLARLQSEWASGRRGDGATGRERLSCLFRPLAPPPARPVGNIWARAAVGAALALSFLGGAMLFWQRGGEDPTAAPRQAAIRAPREDYLQIHRPYQFGQAMGRDDAIILVSDMGEAP